jgi:hypothetical protein
LDLHTARRIGHKADLGEKTCFILRIPFRSSPLTMVLREHFLAGEGDEGFPAVILTASPSSAQYIATIDTLKYGNLIGVAGEKVKGRK